MKLDTLLQPESLAVVGVSLSNPFNPANVIYHKNNLRYDARTYCVNPQGGTLFGDPVYKSISQVPGKIDCAVLSIRADLVPAAIEECIENEVGGAIIISGGFAETGRTDLQDRVTALAHEHNFPVIGPNCLGIFSPPAIDTFFLPSERLVTPRKGSVALLSQSGGILVDMMIKLTQEGVGISRAVSIGNKAVIDEIDLLFYLDSDPKTSVIGLYLEGFSEGRGRDFVTFMEQASRPVVLLKAGKTPGGSRAVSSHTASIAGDYPVFREVIRQSGAIEAQNEAEFVSYCESLSCCNETTVEKVCIITASGGHGAMASDGCFNAGIEVAQIPGDDIQELQPQLSKSVQAIASLNNPIDLTGSAGDNDFYTATRFFLEKDYVDAVILLLLPYLPAISTDIGARIASVAMQYNKPVITYMPHVDRYVMFIEGFESNGLAVAHSVEGAVHMVRAMNRRRS